MRRPSRPPDATRAGADERVRRLRRRLNRVRRRLRSSAKGLERANLELDVLRRESLNVFPEISVPDELRAAVRAIREEHLTFLSEPQLLSLVQCVLETERAGRPGLVVEAGTARGGSAIALALGKDRGRRMQVYDVFGMIPPPTAPDGPDIQERYHTIASGRARGPSRDEVYYGYREDLRGEVERSFARHGVPLASASVELVPGLFEDTILGAEPVALAHIDGDWYESTMTCLERLGPRLVPGGRMIVDDYFMWSGCRQAVDEFAARSPQFTVEMRAKVHLVRLPLG